MVTGKENYLLECAEALFVKGRMLLLHHQDFEFLKKKFA